MASHETKSCPRCQKGFECKPGNITQCQCYGITFTEEEKKHVAENYNDCLCRDCLTAIKHEARYQPVKEKMQSILSILKK